MEELRKARQKQIKLELMSKMKDQPQDRRKIEPGSPRKMAFQTFGSLAKEKTDMSRLKAEVNKVKEIDEVVAGYHLFESSIREQVVAENTVIAKEQSDLLVMRAIDYHRAIRNLNNMYHHRLRLLQKSFLTADAVAMTKMSMYFVEQRYRAGEIIYAEGDAVDKFYCIVEGDIQVTFIIDRRDC